MEPFPLVGQTLDRYAIEAKLGEGGMGVVYKARDLQLARVVAIKVLPHDKVADADRKLRFVQEAKAASALNHPGIVTIHDIRSDAGIDFIVMEYVEGRTLDEVIPAKGLSPNQTLGYAAQIADALAKAHEAGIIHRDLKPSNLIVTDEGRIKVLDFGLAKLVGPSDSSAETMLPSPRTGEGTVIGTVVYMSPEQAEGRRLDGRSDIFSLGSVMYEMVTGRKAFSGDSRLSVMSKILNEDPVAPSTLTPAVQPDLDKTILRCLRKDPARRYQTMADLAVALEDLESDSAATPARSSSIARARVLKRWSWVAAIVPLAVLAGFGAWWATRAPVAELLRAVPLNSLPGVTRSPSFSPDGDHVVFTWTGPQQQNPDVYVQQIGLGSPLRLTTDQSNDYAPAWSPDGRSIAFLRRLAGGASVLLLIPPLGGPERRLTETHPLTALYRSASLGWCPDSTCVVVSDSPGSGKPDALFVVSVDSGEKRQLTSPPAPRGGDFDPAISPDGNWLVFRRDITPFTGELYRLALGPGVVASGEPSLLTTELQMANDPAWMPNSKEILFSAKGALWKMDVTRATPPARLPFVGEDGVMPAVAPSGAARLSRLAYVRSFIDTNLWRVDTTGAGVPASGPPVVAIASTRIDNIPELSPDGHRVAFTSSRSGELEIWCADLDGSSAVQLTFQGAIPGFPRWSPDGTLVTFHSNPNGRPDIFIVPAAGGKPRILTSREEGGAFPSFSRDGRSMYLNVVRSGEQRVWKMPIEGGPAVPVTNTIASLAIESRDGRFLYYAEAAERPSPLWRMPVAGGVPVKVLDEIVLGNFAVLESGIYYIDRPTADRGVFFTDRPSGETRLQYFDFATGRSTTVATNLGNVAFGLSATSDGRTIFYSRVDSAVDDLMLVENFR